MLFNNALSIATDARDWLANSRHPRILHVFDHACNLVNERREILSIVMSQIGNGPFNLVIECDVLFPNHLTEESRVSIHADQLHLGDLAITTNNAKLWSPRPDWEALHDNKENILDQLTSLQFANCLVRGLELPLAKTVRDYSTTVPLPSLQITTYQSLFSTLSTSISTADLSSSLTATRQLAGLGAGLTPAGDDFILGAVLAAWIIHPADVARIVAEEITDTAAPLTASLSAAWLRAAGKGEAGILWHEFFNALISANSATIQNSMNKILAVGETSGADALAGFFTTFVSWAELASPGIS